jgi:hypothetical protein
MVTEDSLRGALVRHRASTLFLRVPRVDWAAVIAGEKTQFRRVGHTLASDNMSFPRPVVLHSRPPYRDTIEMRLAVLEDISREPLGAITAESLAAENIADLRAFRRYWISRHKVGFRPLTIVNVYCIALWQPGDRERFADVLFEHLYGTWL